MHLSEAKLNLSSTSALVKFETRLLHYAGFKLKKLKKLEKAFTLLSMLPIDCCDGDNDCDCDSGANTKLPFFE